MFNLFHEQQKIYEEENPDADDSQNWMSKNTSLTTSASELSSSEASRTSTSASDRDTPALAKLPPKKTKAKASKKIQENLSGDSDSDATLRKEIKKLQVKAKKAEATADNLKKKMKQDSQSLKAMNDEITAQEDKNKALQDEIMALKRDPQRPAEPEPAPALKPGREDQSPEPEVQP